jgi:hypothetical protein
MSWINQNSILFLISAMGFIGFDTFEEDALPSVDEAFLLRKMIYEFNGTGSNLTPSLRYSSQ